jgi:hypothetical protein
LICILSDQSIDLMGHAGKIVIMVSAISEYADGSKRKNRKQNEGLHHDKIS